MSYGQKPNEAFLQFYGFVDTSYKSDFYSADLVEFIQHKQGIPEDRLALLNSNPVLLQATQSVRHTLALRFLLASTFWAVVRISFKPCLLQDSLLMLPKSSPLSPVSILQHAQLFINTATYAHLTLTGRIPC